MKTRLTEMLHIEHPVMLAGMGGVAYSALTAAVSNAGGYGCLGASTMSSERLSHEIAATRELTSKPFGVDLLTAFPDTLTHNVELLIEGGELGSKVPAMYDTTAANLLYDLSTAYWGNNPDKAMEYANQCLALSEQIGYKKGIGNALSS